MRLKVNKEWWLQNYCKSNDFIPQIEMDWFKESQLLEKDKSMFEHIKCGVIINYQWDTPWTVRLMR